MPVGSVSSEGLTRQTEISGVAAAKSVTAGSASRHDGQPGLT